ncbi:MAG: hypothetical protein IPI00_17855 [Flavobacteriales bacterium]|nr:hypothetical protein [Flavobacteriales bacterium]
MSPVEIVRRIFVDINTNAQRVGAVRQILMDDKDLASLIVQSLVDSAERDGGSKHKDRFIPSMTIDWDGHSLKHSLPHITGVLALHQVVNDNMLLGGVSSINDLRNYNRIDKWVRRMNDFFRVDERIKKEDRWRDVGSLADAWKEYQTSIEIANADTTNDNENYETELFTYDYRVLEVALDTFNMDYASGIVRLFRDFEPYKRCAEIIAKAGGTDEATVLYNALVASRNKIEAHSIL